MQIPDPEAIPVCSRSGNYYKINRYQDNLLLLLIIVVIKWKCMVCRHYFLLFFVYFVEHRTKIEDQDFSVERFAADFAWGEEDPIYQEFIRFDPMYRNSRFIAISTFPPLF